MAEKEIKETVAQPASETVSKAEFDKLAAEYQKVVNAFNKLLQEYNNLHLALLLQEESN